MNSRPATRNPAALSAAVLAWGLLAVHASFFLPFICDDALISLRYTQRLLDGQGLTWTDGERVEGYSNLLWVLLCAGPGALGVDLIQGARLLGLAGFATALLALLRGRGAEGLAAATALAVCGPVAVWTVGGLEQPLQAALLAWAMIGVYPLLEDREASTLRPGFLLALLCWTRPDGALFTVAAAAGLLSACGMERWRQAIRLTVLPLLAVVAQLVFRLSYYGEWLPNSAAAKLAFTPSRLLLGLGYIGRGALWLAPLLLLALIFGARAARHGDRDGRRARLLLAPLVIWPAYVIAVGGDIFPGRRFWVPSLVLAALLLATGLESWFRRNPPHRRRLWGAIWGVLLVLAVLQGIDPENRSARQERWEWEGEVVGRLLARAFPERPLIAVDAAGCLPYFSGLPSLDMLGLNDRHLAQNRPEGFGRGALGHELGDGAYVLDRRPDLIVLCGPLGSGRPCFRSGRELVEDPRFRQHYRLALFEGTDPFTARAAIWVRAESGRVGIRREPGSVRVPAYLLMATGRTVARLDESGALYATVAADEPAAIVGLPLEPGRWRLTLLSEGAALRAAVRRSGSDAILGQGADRVEFVQQGPGLAAIDLLIGPATPADTARLWGIELELAQGDDDRDAGGADRREQAAE